jgi:hypothetical protein
VTGASTMLSTTTKNGIASVVTSLIGKITSQSDANNVRPVAVEKAVAAGYVVLITKVAAVIRIAGFIAE